jgi:hypothetical protein
MLGSANLQDCAHFGWFQGALYVEISALAERKDFLPKSTDRSGISPYTSLIFWFSRICRKCCAVCNYRDTHKAVTGFSYCWCWGKAASWWDGKQVTCTTKCFLPVSKTSEVTYDKMYSQKNKCYWNRCNISWLFQGAASSIPTETMPSIWELG